MRNKINPCYVSFLAAALTAIILNTGNRSYNLKASLQQLHNQQSYITSPPDHINTPFYLYTKGKMHTYIYSSCYE